MGSDAHIITNTAEIRALLTDTKRIAVLGMRPERAAYKPAFYVPSYLASIGLEIIPVPVLDRDVTEILGRPVYRSLSAIPGLVDIVDVFRRSEDIPAHLADMLAKHPRVVWFQSGIRNDAVAEQLVQAGISVVQSRCLMAEYRMLRR